MLVLSVLAVRPDWHEALCHHGTEVATCQHSHSHHSAPTGSDSAGTNASADGCVVSLFAQGHLWIALVFALLFLIVRTHPAAVFPTRMLAIASVDYAWPPVCGPPAV